MAAPDEELHFAIVSRLKSSGGVAGITVYDRVPPGAEFPYIQIGESHVLPVRAACLRSWTVYQTIHVWARDVPSTEAKRIVGLIFEAIDSQPMVLSSLRLVMIQEQTSRVFRDADGLTHHGVIELSATIERPRS